MRTIILAAVLMLGAGQSALLAAGPATTQSTETHRYALRGESKAHPGRFVNTNMDAGTPEEAIAKFEAIGFMNVVVVKEIPVK